LSVFAITTIASVFAYVWLFIVLEVWTKDEITPIEAWLTLSFFFILLIFAFIADRVHARK